MSLVKLKLAPVILVEDNFRINTLPLIYNLIQEEVNLHLFSYEQPIEFWKNLFGATANIQYHDELTDLNVSKCTKDKSSILICSVNQMAMCLGWKKCLFYINQLKYNKNVSKLILIFHLDGLMRNSLLQSHLNYASNAIVSFKYENSSKVMIHLKKNGKSIVTEEKLKFDHKTMSLVSTVVTKEEPERIETDNNMSVISTFKIETEQKEKLEKYNLKLPYMSKINLGESKVYYEPDAVDDWDDEDPDEDLDI